MNNFIITPNAADRINFLILEEKARFATGLRISVNGGGCSGFQYSFKIESEKNADDLIFENGKAQVFIDLISFDLIKDSILDYVEDLGSAGFEIKNPKATARCGCGNSFAV